MRHRDQQAQLLLLREALEAWAASVEACLDHDLGRLRSGEAFTVRLDPELWTPYQGATREVRSLTRTMQSASLRTDVSSLLELADRAFSSWAMDPDFVSEEVVSRSSREILSAYAALHDRLQAAGI